MNSDRIVAYEDQLLKKESFIKLAFVMDLVVLVGAVIGYAWLRSSQFPFIGNILLPVILGGGFYALVNRAELMHIATIKRYRGLEHIQPQQSDTPNPHSPSAQGAGGR